MVEQITYNNKQYPFRVGYYAIKHASLEIKETTGKELSMDDIFSEEAGMEIYEPLLYHSLVVGAKVTDIPLDLKREDMEFVLDFCLFEFVSKLVTFFPTAADAGKLGKGNKSPQSK